MLREQLISDTSNANINLRYAMVLSVRSVKESSSKVRSDICCVVVVFSLLLRMSIGIIIVIDIRIT